MPKFNIKRSISIDTTPEKVYALVRDFKRWPEWSPWLMVEPDCTVSYADDGKSYSWDGKIVGSGEMAITSEEARRSIGYRLTLLKPWRSVSVVNLFFAERNGKVETTWTMDGSLPFFMFWMKSMMVALIGMDYERGLAKLKDLVETGEVPSKLEFVGLRMVPAFQYAGVKRQCKVAEIGASMVADLKKLDSWIGESGVKPAGKSFALYHEWDPVKGITEYTLGYPLEKVPASLPSGFASGEEAAGNVYVVKHTGPYRHIGNAWSAGIMHGRSKVYRANKKRAPFEVHETVAGDGPESGIVTAIHFPAKG